MKGLVEETLTVNMFFRVMKAKKNNKLQTSVLKSCLINFNFEDRTFKMKL